MWIISIFMQKNIYIHSRWYVKYMKKKKTLFGSLILLCDAGLKTNTLVRLHNLIHKWVANLWTLHVRFSWLKIKRRKNCHRSQIRSMYLINCILLYCMNQAHANSWKTEWEWFDGFGLVPIRPFIWAQSICAIKRARDAGDT